MECADSPAVPTDSALLLPWLPPGRRRSVMREIAVGLLIPALRRMAALHDPGDLAALDKGRPTLPRLRSAASWHRLHPVRRLSFLHRLRHAGYVLRACGLTPSKVYEVAAGLGLTAACPDEALLYCAYLSALDDLTVAALTGLAPLTISILRETGFTIPDFIAIGMMASDGDGETYLSACRAAGVWDRNLLALIRDRKEPRVADVVMLVALREGTA